ncbi:unnamed protein product [Chironomus riparius]|uniref:Translation initiation factor eIF2B subunit delta n=1 Tax=Chironomus riparius TaxID=315576 RepID=A0A9N9RP87_9DIPT|nr:unnamed protein product [Chironomus riparius]
MEENQNLKKAAKRKRRKPKNKQKIIETQIIETESIEMDKKQEKSKEQVLAERQAKKTAKKQVQKKSDDVKEEIKVEQAPVAAQVIQKKPESPVKTPVPVKKAEQVQSSQVESAKETEKSRDQVKAEREAKKLAKQAGKTKTVDSPKPAPKQPEQNQKPAIIKQNSDIELSAKMESLHISESELAAQTETKAKPVSKAERRAIQEAQRAAKAKQQQDKIDKQAAAVKKTSSPTESKAKDVKQDQKTQKSPTSTISQKSSALHKVRLFKHLYTEKCDLKIKANSRFHPAIVRLGAQYANDTIVGSNSRCYAFLNAMKILIIDFICPSEKVFSRALETEIQVAVEFLQKCRPHAVSMTNALKYIKVLVSQENSNESDEDKKQRIIDKIDTYAHEQIETAAKSISLKVREKIAEDDVILTYGCSSLIKRSLVEAWKDGDKKFSVVVVDSRPDHEGQEMLKSLTMEGISCTYVLINAISFIMPKVTKVLLGAHALLANGYVMSRVGTAQISMIANSYNVPVLVCCETHKFSERVQTDSFVYNEIGDPNALVKNKNSKGVFEHLKDWESIPHLTPLNLRYDITPPELVTVVVTEVALLPCTSVQVILRVKPSELI